MILGGAAFGPFLAPKNGILLLSLVHDSYSTSYSHQLLRHNILDQSNALMLEILLAGGKLCDCDLLITPLLCKLLAYFGCRATLGCVMTKEKDHILETPGDTTQ